MANYLIDRMKCLFDLSFDKCINLRIVNKKKKKKIKVRNEWWERTSLKKRPIGCSIFRLFVFVYQMNADGLWGNW